VFPVTESLKRVKGQEKRTFTSVHWGVLRGKVFEDEELVSAAVGNGGREKKWAEKKGGGKGGRVAKNITRFCLEGKVGKKGYPQSALEENTGVV